MRSRLEPFKKLVRMLRPHLDGLLAWTKLRLSNGALEGMNNKIKLVSHRAFGFRSVEHHVAWRPSTTAASSRRSRDGRMGAAVG